MKVKTKTDIAYSYEATINKHDLESCLEIWAIGKCVLAIKALSRTHPGLSFSKAREILDHASKGY